MVAQPSLAPFSQWSLESLTLRLAAHLPGDSVAVVHPPKQHAGFSCWEGLVPHLSPRGDPVGGYRAREGGCARALTQLLLSLIHI